ncbi:APC family permease [Bacillus sp. JCM 19034]|uniref:APC family permease n=1 Tax=Bacillus sp. JCM 19034 TaxID=1481928 RepID=UPI000AAC031A|nr:APC family permease [Bacillus sp. JCM 19034]
MKRKQPHLKRTLSLFQVVMLGLAWNTPMIYFSVFGVAYEGSSSYLTPAYAIAVIAVLFTGASYAVMARKIPISGSAYTFVKKR